MSDSSRPPTPNALPAHPNELPPCPVGAECQLPVDLILRTTDGHEIGAHKSNLELYSEDFPLGQADAENRNGRPEVVEMKESSETLKLLLRCMHKTAYPDISSLEGVQFFDLAYAAEKYRVHSVLALCVLRMKISKDIEVFPLESLQFGVMFGYPSIADLAAPRTIHEPLETIKELFGNERELVMEWIEYRELYLKAFAVASSPVLGPPYRCQALKSGISNYPMLRNHAEFLKHGSYVSEPQPTQGPFQHLKYRLSISSEKRSAGSTLKLRYEGIRTHHTPSAGIAVDVPPGSDKPGLVSFAEVWKRLVGGSEATANGGDVALPLHEGEGGVGGGAVWDTTIAPPAHACCPSHAPSLPANQDSAYWRTHSPSSPSSPLHQALVDHFHEIEQLYLGNVSYVHRMNSLNPGLLEGLAWKGQKPPFLLVDCSDSRVNEQGIFDAEPGTMFTAGNIANMFVEEDPSSNAVLSYAVGTLNVKHVVVLGHYGCGGVMASMVPLPEGYKERWLSPSPSPSSSSPSSSSPSGSPPSPPPDLAVQQWVLPIRQIYETTVRWEILQHRERVQRALDSGRITREEVAKILMADAAAASLSGSPSSIESVWASDRSLKVDGDGEGEGEGEGEGGREGVEPIHLRDGAFRALVEENVKANVWRLTRSRVIRDHNEAYAASQSTTADPSAPKMRPVYVHGWVYDLETGHVRDLNVSVGPPGWVPPPGGVGGGFSAKK
ncbi:hypothetical protein MD484_g4312, partial [Candolleomyces efflorescens]